MEKQIHIQDIEENNSEEIKDAFIKGVIFQKKCKSCGCILYENYTRAFCAECLFAIDISEIMDYNDY